jgi:starch synthase
MKVLFVSAEAAPFAKVGGLADVAGALPKALRELGHDARLVMPLYQMIEDDPRWSLMTTLDPFQVPMNDGWTQNAVFKELELNGLPVGFIGTDRWFTESFSSESLYVPGGTQHLFFCAAVLQAMEELDWIPDVVHINDWHTGFLPVLMKEGKRNRWNQTASVFTIHNLAYQGEFGLEALDTLGLPHSLFNYQGVEAWGRVNFLKAGAVFSERVNTVSENYAREIQTQEYGSHLDGLMRHLSGTGRLSGILNGIDLEVFNPETDPDIAVHFSADDMEPKQVLRSKLLAEVGLPELPNTPLFGVVSRISGQKGLDLIVQAAETLFALPIQLIVQGLGEPGIAQSLRDLQARFPDHFRFMERFDAPLAQRVYAGSDGFLMPSKFEPCGLGQLIAMRYGTVPVVRRTGGLADTVFENENGFVFEKLEPMELVAAVTRAVSAYHSAETWHELMYTGMTGDYSWAKSAEAYVALYKEARKSRLGTLDAMSA